MMKLTESHNQAQNLINRVTEGLKRMLNRCETLKFNYDICRTVQLNNVLSQCRNDWSFLIMKCNTLRCCGHTDVVVTVIVILDSDSV